MTTICASHVPDSGLTFLGKARSLLCPINSSNKPGLRVSEGRLGVQIGRWGFSLRFGGSDWAVGAQIGRWGFRLGGDGGFRLGGGGSDWVWRGFRLGGRGSDWGWRGGQIGSGFRLGGEGSDWATAQTQSQLLFLLSGSMHTLYQQA